MISKKLLAVVALCLAVLLVVFGVHVVYADPVVPGPSPVLFVVVVFLVTVTIEACGIYFLLKALNVIKEPVPEYSEYTRRQCIFIALILNLITFFFGNYILLPVLSFLFGS